MARYDIDTGDYQGIGTGGLLRYAMMQKLARDKAASDMAVAQYQGGIDLVKQGIASGNDYIKSGGAAGIDALLGTLGIQPGFAKSVAPANAAGLDAVLAEATKNRGQGVKDMSIAGFKQIAPDGTVDVLNQAPLQAHVNPGDQASMASANKPDPAMLPEFTVQSLQGDTVITAKQKGAIPQVPGPARAPANGNAGGPAAGATSVAKQRVDMATKMLSDNGYTVTPVPQADGSTIIRYRHPAGQVGEAVFDKNGQRVK